MDKNQHQDLETNRPVLNRDRSRRCRSKLLSALEYAESQQSLHASDEQSPERAVAGSISQRRDVADTLSPGKAVADTLSQGRVVADTQSPGRDVADTLSPGRNEADTLSPGRDVAETLSPGQVVAYTLSPGRTVAGTLSPGGTVANTLSPQRAVADTLPTGRDVANTLSPGRDVANTQSPGRDVTDTLPLGRDVANTLSPGRDLANTLSPGRDVQDTLSTGRDETLSPGRAVADTQSLERAIAYTLSPGRTVADTLSPGGTVADTLSSQRAVADTLSPGRAVADKLPSGGNVADALSPQQAIADLLSPDFTDTLSPGRAASAHSIDKSDPKRNIYRSSSKSSSQVYDTPQPQRLDMTSGIGSALSSPEPSLFAIAYRVGISPLPIRATPLPPIKSTKDKELKQQELDTNKSKKMFDFLEIGGETSDEPETLEEKEKIFQAHRKKKEEERQKAVKEREDLGLQVVLPHQMKALALKLGKGNGLKAGSLIRREDYLTKTENMQKGCSKKTETSQEKNSVTESNAGHMADLPSQSKQQQRKVPLHTPKVPHPPSRPKGNIVVRETKASRLRKNKLQMQSEKTDKTQKVLPPVKAPVKQPTRASIAATHQRQASRSPQHSRSSSESPPPTPIELEPSRPTFVPKLDLSGLLSPENYQEAYPIPFAPRDIVVRETKASKLLRLKKLEDEKLAKRRTEEEKIKDMVFGRPLGENVLLGKRSPTQTFRPAPPKPYKKPEPVVIKETRASKLRKLREIKDEGNKGPPKKNKILERSQPSQQRLNMEKSATDTQEIDSSGIRNGLKRGETPMAHSPLQNKSENTAKKGRVATPAIVRQIRSNSDCPDEQLSRNVSNQLPGELISQSEKKNLAASSKNVSGSVKNSLSTSRQVQSPPMTSKPNSRNNSEKQAAIDVNKAKPLELKEHVEDKEREKIDESIRNKLCRIEMARGLKVRKEVRLAMEEDEIRWQSELMEEFKDIEGPFVFGKPDDNNREIIRQALDSLKEQLEEVEAADKKGSKSKVKSFISIKCGSYLKNKEKADKEEKEIENIKKEREEKIDGYFTRTVHSLNSVLGDIWERFNYQQDNYREMLEKVTLQEEMLNKWKSEAKHYRFMHTMLKKDYLGERKESWYL